MSCVTSQRSALLGCVQVRLHHGVMTKPVKLEHWQIRPRPNLAGAQRNQPGKSAGALPQSSMVTRKALSVCHSQGTAAPLGSQVRGVMMKEEWICLLDPQRNNLGRDDGRKGGGGRTGGRSSNDTPASFCCWKRRVVVKTGIFFSAKWVGVFWWLLCFWSDSSGSTDSTLFASTLRPVAGAILRSPSPSFGSHLKSAEVVTLDFPAGLTPRPFQ